MTTEAPRDEYTPSTGEVRADYVRVHTRNFDSYLTGRSLTAEQEFWGAAFDRWLAQRDAEAEKQGAARARKEAMSEVFDLLADRGCWGDYLGSDGSRQYGFGVRPLGNGPTTGVLDWLLEEINHADRIEREGDRDA